MKNYTQTAIENLRLDGIGAAEIALRLGLSVNTVRSHIRRHPELPNCRSCRNCGKPIPINTGHRAKKYCSDFCRLQWWNTHPAAVQRKAYYTLTCSQCGKEFTSYGNQHRKYCCRDCYRASRRPVQPR